MRVDEALRIADMLDSPYIRVVVYRDLTKRKFVKIERQITYAPNERWENVTDKYELAQNIQIRDKNNTVFLTCKEGIRIKE